MNKKNMWIYSVIGIIVLIGVICILLFSGTKNTNTKIEDKINTYDDLKKAKGSGQPVSEFDKCIKEANEADANYELYKTECMSTQISVQLKQAGFGNSREEYLTSLGYTDTIDCIENYDNPICEDTDRYNADVNWSNAEGSADSNAYDYCMVTNLPLYFQNNITVTDCYALLK